MRRNTIKDVWRHVDRSAGPDACWPWLLRPNRGGYGEMRVNVARVMAHRAAWEDTNGPIPEGLKVLHRCDNPPCCNPAHLFLGTIRDNNEDMWAKGRGKADTHGAKHGTISGYRRHATRAGGWTMPACDPCREAVVEYQRKKRAS